MNKITIINAYGRSNRGDSVLLDECIEEITNSFSNVKIAVSVFEGIDTTKTAYSKIDVSERIGNSKFKGIIGKLHSLMVLLITYLSTTKYLYFLEKVLSKKQRETLSHIRDSEIIISAPGGYIHDTNFAYYIALFHLYLGIRLNKKVILAPQSIGPIENKIAQKIARYILSRSDAICPRESYSYEFLIDTLKINPNIVIPAGDSAFWNDNVDRNPEFSSDTLSKLGITENNKILGMTVVGWTFPKSKHPERDKSKYINALAKISDYMYEKYHVQTVIFNQVSDDLETAYKVQQAAKHKIIVDPISREPEYLRNLISQSDIFLGTRFHSCIFAMLEHKPTIAISYLPKTTYILKDLELIDRQVDINDINPNQLLQMVENDFLNILQAEQEIKNSVIKYRQKFSKLSDVLINFEKSNIK
jgi:colanic acid/amylovoran biosynthesis protein